MATSAGPREQWRRRRGAAKAQSATNADPDSLTLAIPGLSVLPVPARSEFESHLLAFGEDLFTEAGRIEADYRDTEIPQFTDTMIRDAAKTTRKVRLVTEKLSVGAIFMNGIGGLMIAAGGITASFSSGRDSKGVELMILGIGSGAWQGVTVAAYLIGAALVITSFFLPRKASR